MMGTPYNTIGAREYAAMGRMFLDEPDRPLSGYLAGRERGGFYVQALEDKWAKTFQVRHAIACNSATSGLLAAAFAVGLQAGNRFAVPAMTMSATAAAPMFTGAEPIFCDVAIDDFGISATPTSAEIKAVFITNLFGHPAALHAFRAHADREGTYLIEDNAQAPFAMERGRYAGTIGHIGVFSLNVHKHFHCGEGGVIVTNDDHLAWRMRGFINHGENSAGRIGLNLRMPEVCAAIALTQFRRGLELVEERRAQAREILTSIGEIPGLRPPVVRDGCTHSYYTIPFLVERNRTAFCAALADLGVPVVMGYGVPLYRLPAFHSFGREGSCPVVEELLYRRLLYIENCAHTFSEDEIRRIGDAFRKAAEQCRLT